MDNISDSGKQFDLKGFFYVLLSAILFSLGGVLIKSIPWSPISIHGARSIFTFLVFIIYIRVKKHNFTVNKTVFLSALAHFAMAFAFVNATKLTTAANAIVLQFTAPIFVILLMLIIFKKKPDRKSIITCVVVIIGILFFFFDKLTSSGILGNILAIFSGFCYALVFMAKSFKKSNFESSLIISSLFAIFANAPFIITETHCSVRIWILVFVLGVFQDALALIFLSKGLDHVSPVTASLTSTIEPILNPLLVAVFCHESIGGLSITGAVLVIAASTIYNILDAKKQKT